MQLSFGSLSPRPIHVISIAFNFHELNMKEIKKSFQFQKSISSLLKTFIFMILSNVEQ